RGRRPAPSRRAGARTRGRRGAPVRPGRLRRRGRRHRGAPEAMSDESTRARVIDAAIACILDEGFYRASSNKIAKRAGVTWGVIQYHFGTREALMLAVHERGRAERDRCLVGARIGGRSPAARWASVYSATRRAR